LSDFKTELHFLSHVKKKQNIEAKLKKAAVEDDEENTVDEPPAPPAPTAPTTLVEQPIDLTSRPAPPPMSLDLGKGNTIVIKDICYFNENSALALY
jgi:hypothetical protein